MFERNGIVEKKAKTWGKHNCKYVRKQSQENLRFYMSNKDVGLKIYMGYNSKYIKFIANHWNVYESQERNLRISSWKLNVFLLELVVVKC